MADGRRTRRGASKGPTGTASRSIVDDIYDRLAEEILDGTLPPDDALVVGAIASRMDVSTVPVREALRRLEGERLVYFENNRGARVSAISLEDLRDIYASRCVIESAVIRANIEAKAIDLGRLRELFETMADAYRSGRLKDAYLHHRHLHECLAFTGTSPRLEHMAGALLDASDRYLRLAPGLPTEAEVLVALHQNIVKAVLAGDACAAVTAVEEHMAYSIGRLAERRIPGRENDRKAR